MGANKMEEAALHMLVMARRYVVCGIRTYWPWLSLLRRLDGVALFYGCGTTAPSSAARQRDEDGGSNLATLRFRGFRSSDPLSLFGSEKGPIWIVFMVRFDEPNR